jgi:phosphoribosylanthranilate isomerase
MYTLTLLKHVLPVCFQPANEDLLDKKVQSGITGFRKNTDRKHMKDLGVPSELVIAGGIVEPVTFASASKIVCMTDIDVG